MKKKLGFTIGSILLMLIVGVGSYFAGTKSVTENKGTVNITDNTEASMTIAVVNLDEGTGAAATGKIYYGERVIRFPNSSFLYTSLEDARQGIENDTYAAYMIIPSTFSASIDSLNGTPAPATIQYALNENMDGEIKSDVLYQVLSFGEQLNTDLSYMYLANVLREFHGAQDSAALVMTNDLKDKDAIEEIQATDLVEMVSLPELKQEENNAEQIDVASYMETNGALAEQIDTEYQANVEDVRSQIASMDESGTLLTDSLRNLSKNVGEINLTTDENGNNLYEGGLRSLTEILADFNNGVDRNKTESSAKLNTMEEQRKEIAKELTKSIDTYNQRLKSETAKHLLTYRDSMKPAIPAITCTEGKDSDGTQFQISCEQIEGMGEPPIVTLKIVSEDPDENKKQTIKKILERIVTAYQEKETVKVSVTVDNTENPDGNPDAGPDQTIADEGPQEIEVEVEVNKSVQTALNLGEDDPLRADIRNCGYDNAPAMLTDYAAGNIKIDEVTSKIEVEGDISELQTYIQSALDTVDTAAYVSTPYAGAVVDQAGEPQKDESGNIITIVSQLENYKALIEDTQDKVTTFNTVDAQSLTDIVTNDSILPLVERTESVKNTIQQRYTDETTELSNYEKILNSYHPIISTANMQEYVAQMKTNGSDLQRSITENNQSYLEFTNKVYTTTTENIMTLQTHIQEAKEASVNAVASGLEDAKSIKGTTSVENQQAMAEFAAKLPFSRLGTMEYTQAYQFMANPLQLTPVSEYQRLKDEVSIAANVAGTKELQTVKSRKYVQWILYTFFVLLVLTAAGGYVIRTKGLKNRKPHYISN